MSEGKPNQEEITEVHRNREWKGEKREWASPSPKPS